VLCIGHAGASAVAPANSLRSFALAASLGADRIEFDVRGWRGEAVLAHSTFDARFGRCLTLDAALSELAGDRYDGIDFVVDLKTRDAARPAVEALRRHGLFERALLTSQCPPFLALVREHAPDAQVGISVAGVFSRRLQRWGCWRSEVLAAMHAGHYDALMAHHRLIDAGLVDAVAAAGAELHAWTVHERRDLEPLRELGVDGVVTGDPRLVRDQRPAVAA
jgi:glycerophosphoryl diester phosphodiesterase